MDELSDSTGGPLIYPEESYHIQGAIFEVYREMGPGYLESVYQECLERELQYRDIPFKAQYDLQIRYKGAFLQQKFRADFLCFDSIVVEIKAISELNHGFRAQLINYLKTTNLKLGMLVNFGSYPKVAIERYAR